MIGLPGDNMDACLYSARETVRIGPSIARLYPTIVIADTALFDMSESGSYRPLPLPDAIRRTTAMYRILTTAGINVIRVGLKSSDIITQKGTTLGDTFHPAFRQLVEGQIAREDICDQLDAMLPGSTESETFTPATGIADSSDMQAPGIPVVLCTSSPHSFSNLIGHKAANRLYFADRYPGIRFRYQADPALPDGVYRITFPVE
jgi:hypothetical protein